ncbi:MAG: hypothetical protein IRZ11_04970 [Clostridia bacterium]|nr:hypothetical protein [Clostridia bacterium]
MPALASRRLVPLLAAAFLAGALLGAGLARLAFAPPGPERVAGSEAGATRPAASAGAPRIGEATLVVTRTRYAEGDCEETLEQTTRAPADWVGMTKEDLAARYPDAAIVEFSPERVVIERSQEGCPYRGRTVLLRMGRVGVYYGTPNNLGPLERETDVTEDDLTAADRERLSRGIVVDSDEEVDALLEGLGR